MKKFQFTAIALSGFVMAGLLLSSCKKSTFENNNPETAGLMAFNLAAGKAVTVDLSGRTLGMAPLAFNSYTGTYLSVYPGDRTVVSYDYSSGDTLAATEFNFQAKKYYSAFVLGKNNDFQNVIVEDKIDSLSGTSGKAYIRYVNAISESVNPTVTVSANGGYVINENAAFASVSEYVAVDPGSITIAVSEGSSIQESRTITVEAKKVYTLLLTSAATSGGDPQIKFVLQGILDGDASARIGSAGQAVSIK